MSDRKFSMILSGTLYAFGARVVATILALGSSVIVARKYGAGAIGALSLVNAFLMVTTIVTLLGTSTSVLRLIPEHIAKYSARSAFRIYRKIELIIIVTSITVGILMFLGSDFLARTVFSKPHLAALFALSSAFIVFKSLIDLCTQTIRGLKRIMAFASMQVIPAALMLAILLVVPFISHDPNIPIYAQLTSFALTGIVGVWIVHHLFRGITKTEDIVEDLSVGAILRISIPMLVAASVTFLTGQTGVVTLGVFKSEVEVGYYTAALKLSSLTLFIIQAINTIAAPRFSELFHAGNIDELFYVAKKSSRLAFWSATPILLILIFFGRGILRLLFGDAFVIAYPSMMFLVVGQFINSISGSTGYFLSMTGHQDAFGRIMIMAALINVSLCILLVPPYGIIGAAIAGMVGLIFWNLTSLLYIKRQFGRTIGYVPLLML